MFGTKKVLPSSIKQNHPTIESYFLEEIKKSKYLKQEKTDIVMKHLSNEIDLLKSDNILSVEEKKELGINPRLKLTKEYIGVLSEDGIRLEYPREVLKNIYLRATFKKLREEEYLKFQALKITKIKLKTAGVEECDWCKNMQKKEFLSNEEIRCFINNECQCVPYSKCYLEPVIDFND